MKIFVAGAMGNLGSVLCPKLKAAGHEVIESDRNDLDLTDHKAVLARMRIERPDVIMNCAAYNAVDDAEADEGFKKAMAVNRDAVRSLAASAKLLDAIIVHFSTDYVFAGDKPEGYTEDDIPKPISRYGISKLAGEKAIRAMGVNHYIVRLSKIFGPAGRSEAAKESFVHLMLRLAASKPELSIVDEEVGSPTYTEDIADATIMLLEGDFAYRNYHFVNEGPGVTWYQFAKEVFEKRNVQIPYHPVPSSAFPKPAARPKFAALKSTTFPLLRSRTDALDAFLATF
ncbi:MAG: dTDP-4-dehydrorhamnose reductase [bacterium]|nr:dTDP-4-dehydrorhamnose reductase [bacterium]MDA1024737.1 dTDP-4-dehydrorhamnose reductase [bacterium]